jgi:ribulose kinase
MWRCIIIAFTAIQVNASSTTSTRQTTLPEKIVIGIDGGTESIRACCFNAFNGEIIGKPCAVPYQTYHPKPGYAEQNPDDWWNNLGRAVKGALESVPVDEQGGTGTKSKVCAICVDTTCCSVVALDRNKRPLRSSLLWMDARSAPQTVEILKKCKRDPALKVNCNGQGPLSAEWMTPKALWIKQNEPIVWENAETICEYQDFVNYKLTGKMVASACNAAARWHWDGNECTKDASKTKPYPGRPISLYKKLNIPELADKLPAKCLSMGDLVGTLTKEAAEHLGLNEGTIVAQGGPDAFVGMVGLGCIYPQQLCLITGSSHLHCVVTAKPTTATGSWGAYRGAPLSGTNFAEGGQSSTGSIIRWARKIFGGESLDYSILDQEAAQIDPGCDGLVALETFQGSRTPVTDPLARGALVGLTLSHSRGHVWRALMEAVCFGTRACVDGLEKAGHTCDEIIIAGGTTRSPLWLQMHADVTGKDIILCENIDAPLLGCAILASVGAGVHSSIQDAVRAMVRVSKRVEPNPKVTDTYDRIYTEVYSKLSNSIKPVAHSIAKLRGGVSAHGGEQGKATISPSVLAADWANMKGELTRCLDAGLSRIHVDIFDGVFIDSPEALTFGPKVRLYKTCCLYRKLRISRNLFILWTAYISMAI